VATGVESRSGVEGPSTGVPYDAFVSYSHAGDGLLAPRLQAGLQRFAKPWWRRRALRAFRDESSLSANPHLWSSITAALDASEWFVLLTGPEAAASEWVNKEVAYWVENKDPERILPVLTGGVLVWDEGAGRLDGVSSVPPALLDAFSEEPRWVDMRWARDETHLDLGDSRFRGAVADVASAIRGVPKDDLESEEVRQHRRTIRTAWAAAALLGLFAVAAVVGAVYANGQRQEAETQRGEAETQRLVAEEQTAVAVANEERAAEQTLLAVQAESLARSRELAASAINVLDDDPELSILLALEAIDMATEGGELPIEVASALREAVHTSKLRERIEVTDSGGEVWLALSPDATRLAVASEAAALVRLYDTGSMEMVWEYSEPDTIDNFYGLAYSPDGERLVLSIFDSTSPDASPRPGVEGEDGLPARLVVLDAATGEALTSRDYGPCPSVLAETFSPSGEWLAVVTSDSVECVDLFGDHGWRVELVDPETLEPTGVSFDTGFLSLVSWSGDSSRISVSAYNGSGTRIYDVEDGQLLFDQVDTFYGALSPDGSLVVTFDFGGGFELDVRRVDNGEVVDQLAGLPDYPTVIRFIDGGQQLVAASQGDAVLVWDLITGEIAHSLRGTGSPSAAVMDDESRTLYVAGAGQLSMWDLSGASQGEFNSVSNGLWYQADSMIARGERGAFLAFDFSGPGGGIWEFDAVSGEIGAGPQPTFLGDSPAVLPDGRVVYAGRRGEAGTPSEEWGPVLVWDPDNGSTEELVGCWITAETALAVVQGEESATCPDGQPYFPPDRMFVSPDGTTLLVTSVEGDLRFFDTQSLAPVEDGFLPDGFASAKILGNGWYLAGENPTNVTGIADPVAVIDIESGEILHSFETDEVSVSRDGTRFALTPAPGRVVIHDTETWSQLSSFEIIEARIRGLEFSPGGSQLMTGSTDGFVRIWDAVSGLEVSRIPLEGASDGHWLDEAHLVVGTSGGLWTTLTLDLDELVELARSRVTRGLTLEECALYRIEGCG
jgi:WD40 repeat protein